ncbi:hypothetical protein ACTQ54_12265 [Fundicoccus sp. Sow4_H7]|uniref:hypothetical protein n=1 Tax=Fundicoccus sp. Sow4_H7 TaxID=3438784 RepID=UPI003F928371
MERQQNPDFSGLKKKLAISEETPLIDVSSSEQYTVLAFNLFPITDKKMMNTKLINELVKKPLPDFIEGLALNVGKPNKEKVLITAQINIDPNIQTVGNYEFTPYVKAVYDTICTLFKEGNTFITDNVIYRALNDYSDNQNAGAEQARMIEDAMQTLENVKIKLDLTEHYQLNNVDDPNGGMTIESRLLNYTRIKGKIYGRVVNGYQLTSAPILYQYAENVKQIQTVQLMDFSSADLPNGLRLNSTPERIIIKQYLMSRIESMKHTKLPKTILYSTIYDQIQKQYSKTENTLTAKQMRTQRENIERILKIFKHVRYIEDYEIVKKGNKYNKIIITP